jgi:spermidine synthase
MGSTVYSFTLILAVFIFGLATGSACAARLLSRIKEILGALAIVQTAIGVAAVILLPFLGDLSLWFSTIVSGRQRSTTSLLLAQSGVVFLFVFIPTFFMGAVFPLACRLAARPGGAVGRSVAAVYSWNTLGSIMGTLLGSFALVPHFGLAATIKLAAAMNFLLGAALFLKLPPRWRPAILLPAAAFLLSWSLPGWNTKILTAGSFLYADSNARAARAENKDLRGYLEGVSEIITEEWDPYGLVTVHKNRGGTLSMRINGKVDASSSAADMVTQLYLAHIPLLHHPDPKRALVIGLGAGVTLGAVTRHPLEKIDCIEISDAVARAARYFSETNNGCLEDPRVTLTIGDGRNAILFGREKYDVIICQPSNLWLSGMANLFTRDFFRDSLQRLAPGGLFCQWIHAYRLSTEDFQSIVRTFYGVFESGSVWEVFPGTDYLLLGMGGPLSRSYAEIEARLADPKRAPELLDPAFPGALALMGHLVTDAATARAIAGPGKIITDDHCAIEYTAPLSLYKDDRVGTLAWLDEMRRTAVEKGLYEHPAEAVASRREGRRQVAQAMALYSRKRDGSYDSRGPDALRKIEEVGGRFGRDRETQEFFDAITLEVLQEAKEAWKSGRRDHAFDYLRSIPPSSKYYADGRKALSDWR